MIYSFENWPSLIEREGFLDIQVQVHRTLLNLLLFHKKICQHCAQVGDSGNGTVVQHDLNDGVTASAVQSKQDYWKWQNNSSNETLQLPGVRNNHIAALQQNHQQSQNLVSSNGGPPSAYNNGAFHVLQFQFLFQFISIAIQ